MQIANKKIAKDLFSEMDNSNVWNDKLLTEISTLGEYYIAEKYHQDYIANS